MEAGWPARRVACQLGISDCVVRRSWNQWIREMSFTRRPGSGRPRQTSRRKDRYIVAPSLGAPVSSRTIRRRLAEGHLGSRRPLRVLPLTSTHQHLRLEWCRALGNWTAAELSQAVFRDESKFNLSSDDNRFRMGTLFGVNSSILP
ncbi:transposable element Tcb2 transposase [Trichonephila clavipes]|nr:transposable element Tcb2 transposase [Trichonephila clavipes]